MAAYPQNLPAPLISNYKSEDNPNIVRTSIPGGPRYREQVSSHFVSSGNAMIVVDYAQAQTFRAMIGNTSHNTKWLTDMPLDTGSGLANHRVRISNVRWQVAGFKPGVNWRISFDFETDERN